MFESEKLVVKFDTLLNKLRLMKELYREPRALCRHEVKLMPRAFETGMCCLIHLAAGGTTKSQSYQFVELVLNHFPDSEHHTKAALGHPTHPRICRDGQ